jgi:PPM family protein phosphatase
MSTAPDTVEFELAPSPGRSHPKPLSSEVRVDVAGRSHVGNVRPNNEDHFLIVRFGRFLESLDTNIPAEQVPPRYIDDGFGMVVADGMGGHAAGEEASRLAITTLVNLMLSTPDWIARADDVSYAEEIKRRASERFQQVDHVLSEEAENDPDLHGFGTTMTMAASVGKNLFIANIGDSRAYLFRAGKLHQLTRDHTLASALCEAGKVTRAEVATHRLRHVLTKNLGADKGGKPDVQNLPLENGDYVLLCSDGLSEMVSNEKIAAVLAESAEAKTTCTKLIDLALAGGGKDNVTVIVARYRMTL